MEKKNKVEKENNEDELDKSTKIFIFLIVLPIVISFLALVGVHTYQLINFKEYIKDVGSQESIFIATLTLALMIVLIIPYMINKEQIKQKVEKEVKRRIEKEVKGLVAKEIENYWNNSHKKEIEQFTSKSERDYAHISRMMAYLLKQKENYYWAMAWAGDSVVSYIKCFKGQDNVKGPHNDFPLNREYFKFSLNIMRTSFNERGNGTFLEKNMDLEPDYNPKKKSFLKKLFMESSEFDGATMNKIRDKIYEGKRITQIEKEIIAVKELKRIILRYIKWQCIIYIEMQEHEKLSSEVIALIKRYLDFKKAFEKMINNVLTSFYYVDESDDEKVDKEQFIEDIVEKVELEEDRKKVRERLEKIVNL
jgi:hypothetical protein